MRGFCSITASVGDEEGDPVNRHNDFAVGDGARCRGRTLHRSGGYGGVAGNGSCVD